jgi:hypothetical protein
MKYRPLLGVIVVSWMLGGGQTLWGWSQQDSGHHEGPSLINYVKKVCQDSPEIQKNTKTLAVFVEFLRFGCLACLNNFLDFCDTVNMLSGHPGSPNVILFFKRDNQEYDRQYEQMQSWMHATGLNFQFRIAPSDIFEENNITENILLILDHDYSFDYYNQFPLTMEKKREILGRLYEAKRNGEVKK